MHLSLSPPVPGNGKFQCLSSYSKRSEGWISLYFALVPAPPQCRCESLAEVNTQLRLHMEKADMVNKALREDVEKLTVDWSRARDELMRKESQWQMEQEVGGIRGCNHKAGGGLMLGAPPSRSVLGKVNLGTWMEAELLLKSLSLLPTRAGRFALLRLSADYCPYLPSRGFAGK